MKHFSLSFIIVFCFLLMAFKVNDIIFEKQEPISIEKKEIKIISPKLELPKVKIELKNHNSFLEKIGHYESSNDYTKVNRLGYMGRYQFGKNTLKSLDIKVSKIEFLNNPGLQEEAMDRLLTANYKSLKRYIERYNGKIVHGVVITKSGVLAAAHLGGAGNVRKWFRKGVDFKDANGTSITTYMRKFSGYKLDI